MIDDKFCFFLFNLAQSDVNTMLDGNTHPGWKIGHSASQKNIFCSERRSRLTSVTSNANCHWWSPILRFRSLLFYDMSSKLNNEEASMKIHFGILVSVTCLSSQVTETESRFDETVPRNAEPENSFEFEVGKTREWQKCFWGQRVEYTLTQEGWHRDVTSILVFSLSLSHTHTHTRPCIRKHFL